VLAGETQAFGGLVAKYKDAVFGVALSKVGSFVDAEEIAQETFLTAFERLGSLKDPDAFGGWLYRIAANRAILHLRQRQRRKRAQDGLAKQRRNGAGGRADDRQQVARNAMGRLSPERRGAATLFYVNGYSLADISRFTSRPVGTIKRRLHEARRDLREELMAMFADELKRRRPGKKFAREVLAKVTNVRVFASGGSQNCVLLTDADGRCYEMFLGASEVAEILPKVSGAAPTVPPAIHSAVAALLRQLGFEILSVTMREGKGVNYIVRVKLRSGGRERTVQTTYSGRNAIQFAVHTGADVYYDKALAEKVMIRRKDGKPMSPAGAWRKATRLCKPPYRNMREVFRALERNPQDKTARRAIQQANPEHRFESPLVERPGTGIDEVRRWMNRHKGERLEALAAAMIGLLYLQPKGDLPKALRYLKRAHRLAPEEKDIAWDYATVCALRGNADEALELLRGLDLQEARTLGNFASLIDDPRFRRIVGVHDGKGANLYRYRCLDQIVCYGDGPPWERPRGRKALRQRDRIADITAAPAALRKELCVELGHGRLLPARRIHAVASRAAGHAPIMLVLTDGRGMHLPSGGGFDRSVSDLMQSINPPYPPWETSSAGTVALLGALKVRVWAVVLTARDAGSARAKLFARRGRRTASADVDALDGLAMALRTSAPVLVAETLADELCVRGKTGRPLSVTGAVRKLRDVDLTGAVQDQPALPPSGHCARNR
jgi:RNA polymerase sigma-70 factor (ECF subfamily)